MNLGDLLAAERDLLGDETEPYLWSDAFLTRAYNNAVREACLRARLLKDDALSQPKLCSYALVANQPVVPHAKQIIVVRSGMLLDASGNVVRPKLWALTAESLDKLEPCWEANVNPSQPQYMVMDLAQKTLRLYPTPDASYTLKLRVWREPVGTEWMKTPNDTPVIQIPGIEELKHWVAHEAYLKKDAETEDKAKSEEHLAIFEARFGQRPSLHELARWADSPPRVRTAVMF